MDWGYGSTLEYLPIEILFGRILELIQIAEDEHQHRTCADLAGEREIEEAKLRGESPPITIFKRKEKERLKNLDKEEICF